MGCSFLLWREPLGSVRSSLYGPGLREFKAFSIEFISICYPNDIIMMITKAPQNRN